MTRNYVILVSALLLLLSSAAMAFAQDTPAAPSVAPLAQSAPVAPASPSSPAAPVAGAFTFGMESGNFMGIVPVEITKENMSRYGLTERRGVAIVRVIQDSPAERAGLKKDDVILRFDGEAVTTPRKLNRLIGESEPDHVAKLGIRRAGVEQEISVTLQSRSPETQFRVLAPGRIAELNGRLKTLSGKRPAFSVNFGSSRRIGVNTQKLTRQLSEFFGVTEGDGLLVTNVNDNSAGSKGGLKAGDVITEVDGQRVSNASELSRAINRRKEGEVTLTVVRHKSRRTIKLTPEAGNAFDFSPELFVPNQVGEISIPRVDVTPWQNFDFQSLPNFNEMVIPDDITPIATPM